MPKNKTTYLCGVSFQHELGECDDIHFYDSVQELKEKSRCWQECGIVELELDENGAELNHKWIVEQNLFGHKK